MPGASNTGVELRLQNRMARRHPRLARDLMWNSDADFLFASAKRGLPLHALVRQLTRTA